MAQVSLLAYLQDALPAMPIAPPPDHSTSNTTNQAYGARNIRGVEPWVDFSVATIMQNYSNVLNQARIAPEPIVQSPPSTATEEDIIKLNMGRHVYNRVRRALRTTFALGDNETRGLTTVSFDAGGLAAYINQYKPDCAYFEVASPPHSRPNRVPGDIKPSWKWASAMRWSPENRVETEFRQVLSQVNFYMKQHHARYGFVLTDRELVVFRRTDRNGHLELADPIPFTRGSTAAQPQMTVLLALWYLGMLAAQDQGDGSWNM